MSYQNKVARRNAAKKRAGAQRNTTKKQLGRDKMATDIQEAKDRAALALNAAALADVATVTEQTS